MSKYGLDKFYTKKEIAKQLIDLIDKKRFKTIIEPSAGNGSFSKQTDCIAFDILPEDNTIIQQDFLTLNTNAFDKPVLIIGNPPFGRNSSLALAFLRKACSFADEIAFILPKSFKKQSVYDKIDLYFWKEFEMDLPENSFTYNDEEINIPCVFQIYRKKDIPRIKEEKLKPIGFSFVKKESSNVSIRRVGVNAGKASTDINKSVESHYFIYIEESKKDDFVNYINSLYWEHNNTVGPRSISKNELLKKLDKK